MNHYLQLENQSTRSSSTALPRGGTKYYCSSYQEDTHILTYGSVRVAMWSTSSNTVEPRSTFSLPNTFCCCCAVYRQGFSTEESISLYKCLPFELASPFHAPGGGGGVVTHARRLGTRTANHLDRRRVSRVLVGDPASTITSSRTTS